MLNPIKILGKLALGTIVAAGAIALVPTAAKAAEFSNGWYYVQDSLNDGSNRWGIGTAHSSNQLQFEMTGLAVKVDGSTMTVAVNSYTPLGGLRYASGGGYAAATSTTKNPITFGDLFLNFSGQSFNDAMDSGNLFGVRFDDRNESGVAIGVYRNVEAKSVTGTNNGYDSLKNYNQRVSKAGKTASMGDINGQDDSYFVQSDPIKAVISSGDKLSNTVSILPIAGLGLESTFFGTPTNEAFAFSFSTDGLPMGSDFLTHLFYECGNDGVALAGTLEEVPEPTGFLGLAVVGMLGSASWLRRKFS